MKHTNLRTYLKKTIEILRGRIGSMIVRSEKYLKFVVSYFQTSETIFLLLFANIIGVGQGLGPSFFDG